MNKKILDVTCGSRTIWFDKHHPAAVYCDIREERFDGLWKGKSSVVDICPDVICSFTDLPFPDESYSLVIFDSPHLIRAKETSWLVKSMGSWTIIGRRCCVMVSGSVCGC